MQADLLLDAKATVGESPAGDARTQTLYWVDILEKRVLRGELHPCTSLMISWDALCRATTGTWSSGTLLVRGPRA